MKIAIPSSMPGGLEATLNHHFGQTNVFTIVNVEGKEIKEVNLVHQDGPHSCAGIVELIKDAGADITIVGGIGGRPLAVMLQLGIKVYSGATGTIQEAINAFLNGQLQEISQSTCE
ncbi:MAG: NifB/NifX family molybdenum-iron cluster-binding protein [Promethearchaeota archaeon]